MLGWIGRVLAAGALASCAAATTPQPAPTLVPLRFAGPVANLVLPVTELPTGTRITTEGRLTTADLDAAQSPTAPGAYEALLIQHDFIAAYFRTFGVQKSGGKSTDVECIVLLFADKPGLRDLVSVQGDAMLAYGYRPISMRQTIGDASRAVSLNGTMKDASGRDVTVTSVRIMYALANLVVQISIQDDPKNVDPLDAIDLANRELQYLQRAAPLASPR